jgi:3-methyl-2-oxobutanoate hydroxymethyltransferase
MFRKTGPKLTMLTAYDYPTAKLMDEAGIDLILVGDSLGMTVQGHADTLSVTLEQMIYHTGIVQRAVKNATVIADMPYGTFHKSVFETVQNVLRVTQASGVRVVKMEGASSIVLESIPLIIKEGIAVVGHVGLEPQRVKEYGGFKKQGKDPQSAQHILTEALALQQAGVVAIVLESIPEDLAQSITQKLAIPTIGIGAGPHCDGQVLVWHDVIGLSEKNPAFAKKYLDSRALFTQAIWAYKNDVQG